MYQPNSLVLSIFFLVSMIVALEFGNRMGFRAKARANEPAKSHINAVQASLLGILALLLAFTLSLALQRFDSRSVAVDEEANSIGTAYLRSQLLPASVRAPVQSLFRAYIDLRVKESSISLERASERDAVLAETNKVQNEMWQQARQAAAEEPNPVTTGLFIQSLNDLIDAFGRREAALNRHVPEMVLILLYFVFVVTASVIGYAVGIEGNRPSMATYVLIVLIVLLVFVVMDLDNPRRGFINVNYKSLTDLQQSITASQSK